MPNKEGKKIGKVKIPEDILVSFSQKMFDQNVIENSMIAVSEPNNDVLLRVHNDLEFVMEGKKVSSISYEQIYRITKNALITSNTNKYLTENEEYKIDKMIHLLINTLGFEYSSISSDFEHNNTLKELEENVIVDSDRSWDSSVYECKDLNIVTTPLEHTTVQEVTIDNKSIKL
ncbi:hypothetical protein [Candidatus Mesenet endosymbiont of Phosphuga atrata]|uniref:hypothetical protein n=1 Tax=Candidatus Mesenet endosymbiont of Phosphuga atrata TaxID=3066221 RepID=UPI0030CDAE7B